MSGVAPDIRRGRKLPNGTGGAEQLERPVDRREPEPRLCSAGVVVNVRRREGAGLRGDRLDDGFALRSQAHRFGELEWSAHRATVPRTILNFNSGC